MVSSLDGEPLTLCWARAQAPSVVRWTMSGARTSAHEHPVGHKDEAWVLVKALDSMEGDRVYRDAVLAAADWVGQKQSAI
jgi:hypothetical protein